MSMYLGVLLLVVNLLAGTKKLQWGLFCYIVLIFVSPTIEFGTMRVSYDLPGIMVLFLIVLFHSKEIVNKKINVFMLLFCMVLSASTFISIVFYGGSANIISFLGQVRCVLALMLLASYCETDTIKRAIYVIVPANAFIMVCQYISRTSHIWSYQLWGKETTGALKELYELGSMERLLGSFNNVFPAGYFMLFACIVALDNYCVRHYRRDFSIMILALGCGIMTTGKTFMMGAPLALIMWLTAAHWWRRKEYYLVKRRNMIMIFSIPLGFLAVLILSSYLKIGGQLRYYAGTILDGTFLQGRLGEGGVANEALNVFKQHFLMGVGSTVLEGEFLGDSQYVLALHDTGIVGAIITATYLLHQFVTAYQKKVITAVVLAALTIFMGIAGITLFDNVGIVLMAFVELCICQTNQRFPTARNRRLLHKNEAMNNKCPIST